MLFAGEVTSLLSFVSLNMRAIRKILKKLSKHVPPSSPMPGYVALEIDHPHEPGNRILTVSQPADVSADHHDATAGDCLPQPDSCMASIALLNQSTSGLPTKQSFHAHDICLQSLL